MADDNTTREALEAAIENAIAMLNALDGDTDFEPEEEDHAGAEDDVIYREDLRGDGPTADDPNLRWDGEPSMGAASTFSQKDWGRAGSDPWHGHVDGELEPSLGAGNPEHWRSQVGWGRGNRDLEQEHDGREPDHDNEPVNYAE